MSPCLSRLLCKAARDMRTGWLNVTAGEQHCGQKVIEHGIAGLTAQPLFTELARLAGPAGIEGRRSPMNDFLGAVLAHIGHIKTKRRHRKTRSIAGRREK